MAWLGPTHQPINTQISLNWARLTPVSRHALFGDEVSALSPDRSVRLFQHWRNVFAFVAIIGLALPLVLWGLLDNPAATPDNDYWDIFIHIFPDGALTPDPGNWLARNNEHLVLIPALIYAANVALFDGHNLGLQVTSLALSISCALLLAALLPDSIRRNPLAFVISVVIIALLTFTPNAAHSWFLGFSGIIWLGAQLFFLCSISALRLARDRGSVAWFAIGGIFSIVGYLTYSTGTTALLLGLVFLLWWRAPKTWIAGYVVLCSLVLAITVGTVARPEHHPGWVFDPSTLVEFIGRYFGYFLTQNHAVATRVGLIGIALYAIALGVVVRRDAFGRSDLAPWIIIPAFPLGAALVTALSRAGVGLGAATSSRYASLVSLFWIGLLVIFLAMALTERQRLRRSMCLAVFAILALLLLTQLAYRERIEQHIERNHDKRIAEIALALGIHDPELMRAITPTPSQFISQIEILKQMRHAPFAADPDCVEWLGRQIPVAAGDGVRGGVESASFGSSGPPDYVELAGWAGHAGSRAQCIAIVDAAGKCIGVGVSGFMHKAAGASDVEEARIGWRLLKPRLGNGPLQAAALFPEKGGWRRFGGCFRIIDTGKSTLHITKCN